MSHGSIPLINILVVGDSSVGKTTMILKYVQNEFIEGYWPTVGENVYYRQFQNKFTMAIQDTSGVDDYNGITNLLIRNSKIVIFMCSYDSLSSFQDLKTVWWSKITDVIQTNSFIPIFVINKTDTEPKMFSKSELDTFIEDKSTQQAIEICAKTGYNVDKLFYFIESLIDKAFQTNVSQSDSVDVNNPNKPGSPEDNTGKCNK